MSNIEVGEYVRTKDGLIDKIDHYDNETKLFHCENHNYIDPFNKIAIPVSHIVKHSKNIIDLIEVGDYVNEEYVGSVNKEKKEVEIGEGWIVKQKDIKSIVTKEQFKSIEYEVK